MNVAPLKTGKPGRPLYRRVCGRISASGFHWVFSPADSDLFPGDHVFLYVPLNFPARAKDRINAALRENRDIEVVLSFSGLQHYINGNFFYDCRFVGFPSWVK